MSGLLLKGVSKRYGNGINAVSNFNLDLSTGELVVLAGPKGSGKSTILNIICGLEAADEGEIFIEQQSCAGVTPKDRDVSVIFPSHTFYPGHTVYENLEFSLRLVKLPAAKRRERIMKAAEDMGITGILESLPEELAPAESFAAILARAVIREPKIILIDEPFPDIPPSEQELFWQAIINLNKKFKLTMLVATNNPEQALALKARTVVLKNGYIQQVDGVRKIYETPANVYVAQFINHFHMTTVEGVLSEGESGYVLSIDKASSVIPVFAPENKKLSNYVGREVTVGIRHNGLKPSRHAESGIKGRFEEVRDENGVRTGFFKSKLFDTLVDVDASVKAGDKVTLEISEGSFFIFDRDTGKTIL
ncbi:MAG: ABC transporter ATP-binding protein [Clostridia bacterium]|nr:ABC transporter ATP-binding protein [Clostridia bacterium]